MKKLFLLIIALISIIGFGVVKLKVNAITLPLTWNIVNTSGTTYYAGGRMQILEGSTTMDITVPYSDFHVLQNVGGFHSNFSFYKLDGTTLSAYYPWEDLANNYLDGIIKIDLSELGFTTGVGDPFEIGVNVAFLEIQIAQSLVGFPNSEYDNSTDYETYLDDNSEVAIDELINYVRFYSGLSLFAADRFTDIPDEPSADPSGGAGYTFDGWYTADGEEYNFTAVTPDMFVSGEWGDYLYLYAHFRATGSQTVDTTDPATNLPTGFINLLDIIGFNNLSGYILIFVVLSMIVIIGMVLLKLPVLAMAIVEVALTGLFIYFGMLPLWIIIIIIVTMVMIFVWDLKVKDPQGV